MSIQVGVYQLVLFCEDCGKASLHSVLTRKDGQESFICQGPCKTTKIVEVLVPRDYTAENPVFDAFLVEVTDHLTFTRGFRTL